MRHKILTDIHNILTDKVKAAYIISRCEGKVIEYLRPVLRTGIYDENPEGLMVFLQDLFNNLYLKYRA